MEDDVLSTLDTSWGAPSHESRRISKRYQITFRFVTNKVATILGLLLVISMLINTVVIATTVIPDIEELYAADGTPFSCAIKENK
ncbi:hypothetical protein R6242_18865 [Iodobacter sp. CM08]|uniref:hypothetical protein n=1 Tax=Iodobacter sp. CM08 TaxID=3085902 RepID=UPI002981E674|nr:hypothetical protein [Iodobacter sp. CM08]MDW5418631.1 hypothetical protein [Iodobacter sp. CM08]